MKRNMILGAFAIVAFASAAIFLNVVSAQSAKSRDKNLNNQKIAAPQVGSATLVISQLYGAGGNTGATYNVDYIELKNVSGVAQSINGFALQYGSATGQFGGSTGTNIVALPNRVIAPGQYFLIALAGGANGVALPVTADFTSTIINLSGSSGKIALTPSTTWLNCGATSPSPTPCTFTSGNVVDWVAYGAAGNGTVGVGEGGTTVNNGTALTATQVAVRKTAGCTDNDNNNLDFDVVTAAVPRNATSTRAACVATYKNYTQADFDGDGRTDWVITRANGGLKEWWIQNNSPAGGAAGQFGLATDRAIPADFDGDGKTDIAVWREAPSDVAAFYILQSSTATVRTELFGQTGDTPKTVADYDGDGKADVSVYRAGATPGDQSYFYYRGSLNNPSGIITYMPWGTNGDVQTVGDFDGDGKADFCIRRDISGQGTFILLRSSDFGVEFIPWGLPTDTIVPGDYDGDGKSDFCLARIVGGAGYFYILQRNGGGTGASPIVFGNAATDLLAPGDYDGDGKQDIAIWRADVDPAQNYFWVRLSGNGSVFNYEWGQAGDETPTEWTVSGGN